MIANDDELGDIDDEDLARVKQISAKKKELQQTADQVSQQIKGCFERFAEALRGREKQLLRQVEAIHRQQLSLVQSNSEILPGISNLDVDLSTEQELIDQLINFGKINLSNSIAVNSSEPYRVEEYQELTEDHINFEKSLKNDTDELDVSSVLRRKRDSNGNVNKVVNINFDCISCKISESEVKTPVTAPSELKKVNDIPVIFGISNSEKSSFNENKDNNLSINGLSLSEKVTSPSQNVYLEDSSNNEINCPITIDGQTDGKSASKTINNCINMKVQSEPKDGVVEHPVQIQQWLQQILAETETEPIIHEIGQFSKVPNTRLHREFPVET